LLTQGATSRALFARSNVFLLSGGVTSMAQNASRRNQQEESSMKTRRLKHLSRTVLVALAGLGTATSTSAQTSKTGQLSGASCIAMVNPTVQGAPCNAQDAANGVRNLITSYLTGPSAKAIALEAKLPSQAREEAKQKGCEPLLFVTVTRKTGGHGFLKVLGQGAAASAWRLPGGSSAATATASAGAAAGLQAASSMAASTKARDQVRFEYRLESANGQIQFGPKTETQTAKIDGEDLLTPLVARAAEAIVTRKGAQ
jgi:hypothetical protein